MMTPELYVFLFAVLGVYVIATVWHRTAEERRLQQAARAEREARGGGRAVSAARDGTEG